MTSVSFSRSTLPKQGLLSKQNNGHGWVLGVYIYIAIHVSLDFRIFFYLWNLDEFRSFGVLEKVNKIKFPLEGCPKRPPVFFCPAFF